jgi:hypothetical protein
MIGTNRLRLGDSFATAVRDAHARTCTLCEILQEAPTRSRHNLKRTKVPNAKLGAAHESVETRGRSKAKETMTMGDWRPNF